MVGEGGTSLREGLATTPFPSACRRVKAPPFVKGRGQREGM